MNSKKTILLIYAHPDDETVFTAGTIAKYASQGIDVYLLCATSGDMGKTSGICKRDQLADVREHELNNVANLLGIKEIIFLRYPDKQLNNVNKQEITNKIAEIILSIRPTTVITFGEDGATGHVDHKIIHEYAVNAIELAGIGEKTNFLYESYKVPQVFFVSLDQSIRKEWGLTEKAFEPNLSIDVKEYSNIKLKALRYHRTQKDSLSKFLNIRKDVVKAFLEKETFIFSEELSNTKGYNMENFLAD